MADNNEIVIRSEQDAYDTLQLATAGGLPDNVEIRFDGWPQLEIVVKGDRYQGTISPSIMKGFIEFQSAIYRTYALARYNSVNVNKLTREERDALELFIEVEKGSSKYKLDVQAIMETFAERVADKVTPRSLVVIALIVATSYFGTSFAKSYLEERRLTRVAELKSEERIAELEAQSYADELDVRRMQILADATRDEPRAANIREYAGDAQQSIVRSVRSTDETSIGGVVIDGEVAQELTKNARRESKEIRLDGLYRVQVVDASQIDVFKIKVRNETNGDEFQAIVQDDTLQSRYKAAIREAEWEKRPVNLSINAKVIGDDIRSAVVIGAQAAPVPEQENEES
ncbi:hypothetical protein [Salinicola rhizosphaerae]|uniref:Uncharacterized protein n=1 Tax=Salinicola rhizosphaerae TaxID=1443141 RepID=A0ABQ3E624_9GAMM|nr:hypothetical protein [Salinicola rhizosphaerae]GHB24368.1 hypothetical protein GCM10009038_24310 [Salinicola rhizosphaerae]